MAVRTDEEERMNMDESARRAKELGRFMEEVNAILDYDALLEHYRRAIDGLLRGGSCEDFSNQLDELREKCAECAERYGGTPERVYLSVCLDVANERRRK